ncbi:non-ribosomal peptide synthetase [Babesia caballi]|uniref:Non-ribosomal peptide synthetase n=1 Tax=Babesia caballi TaxID=5871 RepID=A0AAV4LLP7_BABCB|nr:non-ribosomal peptide synthetase [Babesia caballi]
MSQFWKNTNATHSIEPQRRCHQHARMHSQWLASCCGEHPTPIPSEPPPCPRRLTDPPSTTGTARPSPKTRHATLAAVPRRGLVLSQLDQYQTALTRGDGQPLAAVAPREVLQAALLVGGLLDHADALRLVVVDRVPVARLLEPPDGDDPVVAGLRVEDEAVAVGNGRTLAEPPLIRHHQVLREAHVADARSVAPQQHRVRPHTVLCGVIGELQPAVVQLSAAKELLVARKVRVDHLEARREVDVGDAGARERHQLTVGRPGDARAAKHVALRLLEQVAIAQHAPESPLLRRALGVGGRAAPHRDLAVARLHGDVQRHRVPRDALDIAPTLRHCVGRQPLEHVEPRHHLLGEDVEHRHLTVQPAAHDAAVIGCPAQVE